MSDDNKVINDKCMKLLEELYSNKDLDFEETSELLAKFRVLTREKVLDNEVLDEKCINSLVDYSKDCYTEAQKCLSNLILNYETLREQLVEPYIKCVEMRLTKILEDPNRLPKNIKSKSQLNDVLYYDLRIIFLLSALCSTSRNKIRDRLVDLIWKITGKEADELSEDNYLFVLECLKTLFNLTLDRCLNEVLAGDVIKKLFNDLNIVKDTVRSRDSEGETDSTDHLLVNLIHILTNMPESVYLKLTDDDVNKILKHLDKTLMSYSKQSFRETVLPVINVCANICKHNDQVRRSWFEEIMESNKDFDKRPEEYDTLKGRLVKLMTSVDVHIKDIAAEFLHALCGEDIEKFITYTGFGNSAAFLSSRGLLSGQSTKGASESGDSNEYQQLKERINPITGKVEGPRKNPMEGMSEEEKEYHANELANAITKLTNLGVMKPMNIDADGKISEFHPDSLHKGDS